eukprot:CAMPEP_0183710604 /NCGR_PEP_ID=MMETSP0737-20130205/6303_1 /TAXON_ID=385413 /ORGANISM="Thalassiosira miniscula, Strain CCMP1093" /LENGTH=942 /DNA_ID=CAMNT_0025938913 /DNA_START=122 /DNA_END=2950 /DNA_ORIENTATION=-
MKKTNTSKEAAIVIDNEEKAKAKIKAITIEDDIGGGKKISKIIALTRSASAASASVMAASARSSNSKKGESVGNAKMATPSSSGSAKGMKIASSLSAPSSSLPSSLKIELKKGPKESKDNNMPGRQEQLTNHAQLLHQNQRQKLEEARRLLEEAEKCQKEAERIETYHRLNEEKEELKRVHKEQEKEVAALKVQIEQAIMGATTWQPQAPTVGQNGQVRGRLHHQQEHSRDTVVSPSSSYYPPPQSNELSPHNIRNRNSNIMKRRSNKNNQSEVDIDMESQSFRNASSQRPRRGRAISTANPLVSTIILLRKIFNEVLFGEEDENFGSENTTEAHVLVMTLLVEAIIGILLAFAAVTFTLFIYNRFTPSLSTTRNIQQATFALMSDNETLKDFQKNNDVIFMDMKEYVSIRREIDLAKKKIKAGQAKIKMRSEYVVEMENEIKTEQYAKIIPELELILGFDKFCSDCIWSEGQHLTCEKRVQGLKATYSTPRYSAMFSAMKKPVCIKSDEDVAREKEKKVKEASTDAKIKELLENNWEENQKDFCHGCEWDDKNPDLTCQDRIDYLYNTYGSDRDEAKAKIMVQSKSCLNSFQGNQEDSKKLEQFCPECEWSIKLSCRQRVEYLVDTYKTPERKATLLAMRKPACEGKKQGKHKRKKKIPSSSENEGKSRQNIAEVESISENNIDAKGKMENYIAQNQALSGTGRLLANWEENKKDFCYDCEWGQGQSCEQRVHYFKKKYQVERDDAMARIMSETTNCLISSQKEVNDKISRFCFECEWAPSPNMRCSQRVEYLIDTYGIWKRKAILKAMETPSCLMSEEKAMEMKQKIDTIMDNWDEKELDYCADCNSDPKRPCFARVGCLTKAFEIPESKAKAMIMAQYPSCLKSAHPEEEEKLTKFCAKCQWGPKMTCGSRVDYLVTMYHNSLRMAKLNAMQRPQCIQS